MGKNTLMDSLMALAGQGNVLVVHRAMVDFAGNLETALLLSQLLYWTPRSRMDGWIAKTDEEWADEIFVSKYKVRKCRERLENKDIIETEVRRFAGNPTVHYRVRQTELSKAWTTFLRKRAPVLSKPKEPPSETERTITEITTEITTEVKDIPATPANPAPNPSLEPSLEPSMDPSLNDAPISPHAEMFSALAENCKLDTNLQGSKIGKFASQFLKAGYTSGQIAVWYGQDGWWYQNDWRGQRGDPPSLEQISSTIGKARDGVRTSTNGPRASPQKQRTYTGTDFRGRDE